MFDRQEHIKYDTPVLLSFFSSCLGMKKKKTVIQIISLL
ncbi:hypothetical protein OIU78_004297 [Salix suchowensis]|nr:hypothetical protein OIU78_004297 [Salix suchowensis]